MAGIARWRFSAKWMARRLDCTLSGIVNRCHAGCCTSQNYWPPRAGEQPERCDNLGENGCVMVEKERPITCLMYPLIMNTSGLWGLHFRSLTGVCRECVEDGPWLYDVMEPSFRILFGDAQTDRVLWLIRRGKNASVRPSPELLAQYEFERALEDENKVPQPRSGWPVEPLVIPETTLASLVAFTGENTERIGKEKS